MGRPAFWWQKKCRNKIMMSVNNINKYNYYIHVEERKAKKRKRKRKIQKGSDAGRAGRRATSSRASPPKLTRGDEPWDEMVMGPTRVRSPGLCWQQSSLFFFFLFFLFPDLPQSTRGCAPGYSGKFLMRDDSDRAISAGPIWRHLTSPCVWDPRLLRATANESG